MTAHELDERHMSRATELAARGRGSVEPNPLVGCVIAMQERVIAEGWHRQFGSPHAEIEALSAAGDRAAGATMYVSLEPCCHHGKTPPCSEAIIQAGVRRVVIAQHDPFPEVDGGGIRQLQAAGIATQVGLLEAEASRLNAPYLKLLRTGRPWIIAKWAMTLDGKIASRSGDSRWISSPPSRAVVHQLRGRVDAIMVGRGTAQVDDPLLTARPPGPRVAARIVADSRASLASSSQLVRTVADAPLIVAVGPDAPAEDQRRLADAGCEVIRCDGRSPDERLDQLLEELGRRRMTNVLVEGGSRLLGSLLDRRAIDEVHVFIGPKLIGGQTAPGAVAGTGIGRLSDALALDAPRLEQLGSDIYLHGHVVRPS